LASGYYNGRESYVDKTNIIKIGDEILAILSRKTIFLNSNDKGRMKDGREVQKINRLWYYIPKRRSHEKEKGPDIWQR